MPDGTPEEKKSEYAIQLSGLWTVAVSLAQKQGLAVLLLFGLMYWIDARYREAVYDWLPKHVAAIQREYLVMDERHAKAIAIRDAEQTRLFEKQNEMFGRMFDLLRSREPGR